jgi:hypothetical protein
MVFQIRDVTYDAGVALFTANSAEEALHAFMENKLRWVADMLGDDETYRIAGANGNCVAVMGNGRRFAAVPTGEAK